jgi:hypothetical protein
MSTLKTSSLNEAKYSETKSNKKSKPRTTIGGFLSNAIKNLDVYGQ